MSRSLLEERVRRLEDRVALHDLNVRYFVASDDRDFDTVAATFASDGVLEAPFGEVRGPAAIVDYLEQRFSAYGPTIHTPHFQLLTFDEGTASREGDSPDDARGIVGAHVEIAVEEQTSVSALRYIDRYVREAGTWKFAERRLRFYYVTTWPEMSRSLVGELRQRPPSATPSAALLPESLPSWRRWLDRLGRRA